MDENAQKLEFALALMRDESNPFKAAVSVFEENIGAALRVYAKWAVDPVVVAEVLRLKETRGKRSFMPTQEDAAENLWNEAQVAKEAGDRRGYAVLMKQFNEVMGYIQKPGTIINNSNGVGSCVMEVPTHGNDDQWERDAASQQQALIHANG